MEKNRSSKVLAVVALFIAVIGLSLGFAAFSNTLTISSSATVTASTTDFNVDFAATNEITSGAIASTTMTAANVAVTGGAVGGTPTIDNTGEGLPTIRDLTASFTAPGQSVTYTFYAGNVGKYIAYLDEVAFKTVEGSTPSLPKVCTGTSGVTQGLLDTACDNITVTIGVNAVNYTTTTDNITGHSLAIGALEPITVTITYDGTDYVDGNFSVEFGDITLKYESVD